MKWISRFVLSFLVLAMVPAHGVDKTVILVHGAFSDATASWDKVIPKLRAEGLKVVAVQNPLTSLGEDVATTRRAIDNASGPVILVGHSYGGAVITEAGAHDNVVGLVYVAAFAPEDGQSIFEATSGYPPAPGFSHVVFDPSGFATLTEEGMTNYFAQDLPAEQTSVMYVTQGPISGSTFTEKLSKAAWKAKPSWYIVAEDDLMIQPDAQRDFAQKMGATTTSYPSGHVIMQSKAQEVTDAILDAARTVAPARPIDSEHTKKVRRTF